MRLSLPCSLALCFFFAFTLFAPSKHAQAECLRVLKKKSKLKVVDRKANGECPKKAVDLKQLITTFQTTSAGPQGEQGPQGPAGPQGAPGLDAASQIVNMTPISLEDACTGGVDYPGGSKTWAHSSAEFQKFEDDSILEVTFIGRVRKPDNMTGNAIVSLSVNAKDPQQGTGRKTIFPSSAEAALGALNVTLTGLFANIPSGSYPVDFLIQGATLGSSGENFMINPGCYAGSYVIVREVLLP